MLLEGGDDVLEGVPGERVELVRRDGRRQPSADGARLGSAAPDEFGGARPVQAHPAVGRVQGLGHGVAMGPQVTAEGEGGVPVEPLLGRRADRRAERLVGRQGSPTTWAVARTDRVLNRVLSPPNSRTDVFG
ncbi:hypothetical protein SHKM778_32650 [Streptomyces sp. KM77-8]|uniref:Uncharacterized protein n=1 Tax=Streptomyces haneummycinicus TaxID=3074435 RepID=A0AAT9HI80_9ACTN